MLRKSSKKIWKQALWLSRVKLLYARITLTKFTTFYFFLALLNCLVLVILQAQAYSDNSEATSIIHSLLSVGNVTEGFVIRDQGCLKSCSDLPGQPGAVCTPIGEGADHANTTKLSFGGATDTDGFAFKQMGKRGLDLRPNVGLSGVIDGVTVDGELRLNSTCLMAYMWVGDLLLDARREDVVTLAFQIWLLILSVVTILNESLPHLGAAFFGHILETAWAGYQTSRSKALHERYIDLVVQGSCNGADVLGTWWDIKVQHTIPVIVINVVTLLGAAFLSYRLFKVYAHQSFSRVGASKEINNVYKLVLLLSVTLQLAGFFVLAGTGLWIDKIITPTIHSITRHFAVYLALFVVVAVLDFPWLVLGWMSVRKEHKALFYLFCANTGLFFAVFTSYFFSPLYRFIFNLWPFFATTTITAYILVVVTACMAALCRLHFGKGLAQYLRVTEELEGMDFTPVNFSKDDDEKGSPLSEKSVSEGIHIVSLPYVPKPAPAFSNDKDQNAMKRLRLSIFSDPSAETKKLSSTPPLATESSPLSVASAQPNKLTRSRTSSGASVSKMSLLTRKPSLSYVPSEPPPSRVTSLSRKTKDTALPSVPPLPQPAVVKPELTVRIPRERERSAVSSVNAPPRTRSKSRARAPPSTSSSSPARSNSSASTSSMSSADGSPTGRKRPVGLPSNPRAGRSTPSPKAITPPVGNYI